MNLTTLVRQLQPHDGGQSGRGELLHFLRVSFPFHPYLVKIACISDRTRVFPKTRIGHWCILIDI
jgi:hypothetical protein